MNTKHLISLCAAVGAISLTGCQSTQTASTDSHRAYSTSTTSKSVASTKSRTIECGRLINNIIAGKNYNGQEFTVYGVALNAAKDGRINVGTRAMYQADQFKTFVSVYDVPRYVKPGSLVEFTVKVDSTHMGTTPEGVAFVVVEAEFID